MANQFVKINFCEINNVIFKSINTEDITILKLVETIYTPVKNISKI